MSRSPEQALPPSEAEDYIAALKQVGQMVLQGASWSGLEKHCVFLNTGQQRFGNISAVSGLDFPDDGRAVAVVDWDNDGDLDLWFVNRTGPQVRVMRNELPRSQRFVAFRLEGTKSNRDAIGARVELFVTGQSEGERYVRTMRAGEGFIAQSSRWMHFGLPDEQAQVRHVEVRWPSGAVQRYAGIEAGGRYHLIEGRDEPTRVVLDAPTKTLAAATVTEPPITAASRVLLSAPVPMDMLRVTMADGQARALSHYAGKPVLVNLWATWCAPCITELKGFTAAQDAIRDAGIEIIAVNVDGMGDARGASAEAVSAKLAEIDYPFASARASESLLAQLRLIRSTLFYWDRPFAIPTSFLLSARGELLAIYTGPVEAEQLIADATLGTLDAEARHRAALPFAGRWVNAPLIVLISDFAQALAAEGHFEAAAGLLMHEENQPPQGRANAHHALASKLLEAERLDDALTHYQRALELVPDYVEALNGVGITQGRLGNLDAAAEAFRRALELEPEDGEAHYNLGVAMRMLGDMPQAVERFEAAVRHDPRHAQAHANLATMLPALGRISEAVQHARTAATLRPNNGSYHMRVALLYEHQKRYDEALQAYRRAHELMPEDVDAANGVAWLTATDPDATAEQIADAVELARKINAATGDAQPHLLDTLAVAYGAAGDFEQAAATAQRAVELAQRAGHADMAADIRTRLNLHEQGQRYLIAR